MAIAPVNKFINISVPVAPGAQKLYEVPTGTTSLLLYAQVANVAIGVTYPTVTFWQKRESRSTGNKRDIRVLKDVEIPPNDGVILVDGRMVLEKTPLVLDRIYIQGTQQNVGVITGVDYDEPTGIATVMCGGVHKLNTGDPVTMSGIYFTCGTKYTPGNATTYNPTTGLLVLDIGTHSLVTGQTIKIADNAMQFTCTQGSGTHAYPRSTDFSSGRSLVIQAVTATTVTVQVIQSPPSTNTTVHTFVQDSGVLDSVTGNNYSGITTNLFPDPQQSYTVDEIIDNVGTSKTFSAYLGSSKGNKHTYEPAQHRFVRARPEAVEVISSSGHSGLDNFTATTGTSYNPNTGVLSVTTTTAHQMSNGNRVKFALNSFTFECDNDNRATQHQYPRASDPANGKWLEVSNVQTNSFDVQVLDLVPSTNTSTHYWMSSTGSGITRQGTMFNVSGADYNPSTGEIVLTIGPNSLANGDTIQIYDNSLIFTCTMDNHYTEHPYPRPTDPASGAALSMAVAGTNSSIRVNVGKSYSGGYFAPVEMEFIASILENSNV